MIRWRGRSLGELTETLEASEEQKRGFIDYSGGKNNKAIKTRLVKGMTAERVAGRQEGKPCGWLKYIPPCL